ncbi:MAG: DUF421 domain-containing protein [Clostridiales bacterium]|nr:DUF421 domain-containing protein [Clostridiales bacterium]
MGKKQISQLTFFDYIVGISIGSVAGTMSVQKDITILDGVSSMIIWSLFPIVFYYISKNSIIGRRLLRGKPSILIQNGKIIESNLKRERFTIDDLLEELRNTGVFNIQDVEFAILETSGKLSLLKKASKQAVTVSQMQIPEEYQGLCANIIIDGNIMKDNLNLLNLTEQWVLNELKKNNVSSIKDILLASVDTNGKLHIDYKNKDPKIFDVLS